MADKILIQNKIKDALYRIDNFFTEDRLDVRIIRKALHSYETLKLRCDKSDPYYPRIIRRIERTNELINNLSDG